MSNWYNQARLAFPTISDLDWPKFSNLLAATSIQARPKVNARRALAIWSGQTVGMLPNARLEVERVLSGQPLKGPKVAAFARALQGDHSAIPIDRWMLRWAGRKKLNPSAKRHIEIRVRQLATRWGISPRDAQARIWEQTIRAAGRTPETY